MKFISLLGSHKCRGIQAIDKLKNFSPFRKKKKSVRSEINNKNLWLTHNTHVLNAVLDLKLSLTILERSPLSVCGLKVNQTHPHSAVLWWYCNCPQTASHQLHSMCRNINTFVSLLATCSAINTDSLVNCGISFREKRRRDAARERNSTVTLNFLRLSDAFSPLLLQSAFQSNVKVVTALDVPWNEDIRLLLEA